LLACCPEAGAATRATAMASESERKLEAVMDIPGRSRAGITLQRETAGARDSTDPSRGNRAGAAADFPHIAGKRRLNFAYPSVTVAFPIPNHLPAGKSLAVSAPTSGVGL
jgi:hypothetical protein